MAIWTINGRTAEALSASALTLRFVNLESDECRLTLGGAFDAALPEFAAGQPLAVLKDALCVFRGRCEAPERAAAGNAEAVVVKALGPFERLKRVVYAQSLDYDTGGESAYTATAKTTSRCLVSGDLATAVAAILAYPATLSDHAGQYAVGTIDLPTVDLPEQELFDLTCAEALRTVLKWVPDAILYVDYEPDIPTVNVVMSGSAHLATLERDISALPAGETIAIPELKSRDDIQVPNVIIDYVRQQRERTLVRVSNTVDPSIEEKAGYAWVSTDSYPSAVVSAGTLRRTVVLRGSPAKSWQTNALNGISLFAWLPNFTAANWTSNVSAARFKAFWNRWRPDISTTGWTNIVVNSFAMIIQTWITREPEASLGYTVDVAHDDVYELADTAGYRIGLLDEFAAGGGFGNYLYLCRVFVSQSVSADGDGVGGAWTIETLAPYVPCLWKWAGTSFDYVLYTDDPDSQSAPTGIAEQVYNQRSVLRNQGQAILTADEPVMPSARARLLRLADGSSELGSGLIQQAAVDVFGGRTTLQFGPPNHLSPQDLVAMLRK
jgi:hypothetical protein